MNEMVVVEASIIQVVEVVVERLKEGVEGVANLVVVEVLLVLLLEDELARFDHQCKNLCLVCDASKAVYRHH